jgi:histone H3/H4
MVARIPKLAVEKLMKKYGAERISEDAVEEMRKILENHLFSISQKASKIATHSKRKTIWASDLKIAND